MGLMRNLRYLIRTYSPVEFQLSFREVPRFICVSELSHVAIYKNKRLTRQYQHPDVLLYSHLSSFFCSS